MAQFIDPFPGLAPDKKLSKRELVRAIRQSLAAEQEAVHLYESIADATNDELVKSVMQEVADEEKVHAGEFQKLLKIMLDDEEGFMDEGAEEVEEKSASAWVGMNCRFVRRAK